MRSASATSATLLASGAPRRGRAARRRCGCRARAAPRRVGDVGDAVDGDALVGEDLLDAIRAAAALGRDEHLEPVALERVEPLRERVGVADDRIERARGEHRRVGRIGRREHAEPVAPWCARAGGRTAATAGACRASSTGLPHVVASVCASAASSSSSSWARSRSRRGSMIATSADDGSRSGSRCSSEVSHGSHDSMPSNVLPSASRSHCSRPHGWVCSSSRARARTSSVGSSSRTGKIHDSRDLGRRTLVGDREVREPIDLVAPQVDAHRMVGGGGIHVDDRAAHRDLAPRLDLVLAPVADRDEPRDELVAVDLRTPCARRRARRPRRAGRGAARARAPARRSPRGRCSPPARSRQMTRRRRPIVSVAGDTRSNGSVSHAGNSSTASSPRYSRRSAAMRSASTPVGTATTTGRRAVARASVAANSARAGSGTATGARQTAGRGDDRPGRRRTGW